jgi:hypothetical protein
MDDFDAAVNDLCALISQVDGRSDKYRNRTVCNACGEFTDECSSEVCPMPELRAARTRVVDAFKARASGERNSSIASDSSTSAPRTCDGLDAVQHGEDVDVYGRCGKPLPCMDHPDTPRTCPVGVARCPDHDAPQDDGYVRTEFKPVVGHVGLNTNASTASHITEVPQQKDGDVADGKVEDA